MKLLLVLTLGIAAILAVKEDHVKNLDALQSYLDTLPEDEQVNYKSR